MSLKHISVLLLTTMVLSTSSVLAQNEDMNLRELYQLCSRFPYNSRCEGLDIPIPLDERMGEEASCVLRNGLLRESGACKVAIANHQLILYIETGERVEFLDNRRGTLEITIPMDQIFAQNYQIWSRVHRLEFGFIVESSPDQENLTNFLTLLTNEASGTALKDQLDMPSLFAERLSQLVLPVPALSSETNATLSEQVQRLLETKACVRCNLSGADLATADLEDANLEGANLQGANLQGANLEGAYLVGANLSDANLTEANLGSVNFTFAILQNAVLDKADLKAANFQGADLQGISLQEARLIAPAFLYQANLENADLRNARLEGANLESANLTGADLTDANLSDISVELSGIPGNDYEFGEQLLDAFIGLPIFALSERGVEFNTNLRSANLSNANLSGVDLEEASLIDANLSGANLTGAELNKTDLTGANLCNATMPDGSISDQEC
jgi:uncharacterized protein YjbI with pentapeptide repeats